VSTEQSGQKKAGQTASAGAGSRLRRSRGTREQTEEALLAAALRVLERDRPLAGVNLREVADEAGVNHGQIYQYFGTRQELLRAAIRQKVRSSSLERSQHWQLPWARRKRRMWHWALEQREVIRLFALLALDDQEVDIFPDLELTLEALERDRQTGALPADSDAVVIHAMASIVYYAYAIFRTAIARRLEVTEDELDRRAAAVYDLMLEGMTRDPGPDRGSPGEAGPPSR
jgi:AcrR family transcriptional regulator